ncbi:DNA-binding transcriptional LysR family regulator [Nitrospirillum amazonense]|uniref:DNA-binding transcriptional LysR family regulator n=1 Tax=Nitrospirillum amazonense TaxID=28077 RepID=A0A560EIJ8_9PROT|nr:LysR family transcriptional regulator [Nitrospirillum amazonense]TWB09199.1 DNA-binding transcriptional LysR family regulator [Nitrospirillum amazonense]
MDWEDLRHFAALATGGTLSAAARTLGVEHATVARRVAALEQALGLKLVDRRGRRLALTAEGERIAAVADRMARDARTVRRLADGARSDIAGTVTISAPPALAVLLLAPVLAALRQRHPALTLTLLGEVRSASLERREADIAVRMSRPTEGDLTARKLVPLPFHLYATPAYLAATAPAGWVFIGSAAPLDQSPQQQVLEGLAAGRPTVFQGNTVEIQQAAAASGIGVALLPDFMAANDPRLAAVPGPPVLSRDMWLVVHSDMTASAPIRATLRCIEEEVAARLARPA